VENLSRSPFNIISTHARARKTETREKTATASAKSMSATEGRSWRSVAHTFLSEMIESATGTERRTKKIALGNSQLQCQSLAERRATFSLLSSKPTAAAA
jgi:hypothetical protein